MNIFKIIEDIEKVDPEVYNRLDSRRSAFKNLGSLTKKTALAAIPLALGSVFQKAYGQSTNTIVEVLNFALKLEYLERNFYTQGLAASGLIPAGAARTAIQKIQQHEAAHVTLLRTTIQNLNGTPISEPTFNFGKNFPDWNTNYQTFLTLAQAFEDTGVRAYKGQAANLINNDAVLTAALQIHSVEARHAAHIRRMRNNPAWIIGDGANSNVPAPAQPVYAGEGNVSQGGINDIKTLGTGYSAAIATAAFDEPLTKEQVAQIVSLFE
ncbi:ferritin-like domain-containing protein [Pontibacter cellulosilyticus]|uniref:Ferritin-like domain-containing protein n=1 Tax=Pontibacter cellulosilyticus TaxID=1720253 RepID=A0A923N906_9BACT|nr:ferritin-like domain-containing protein [Pontibacter cellulosilyticus]MBC5994446.1 ferritin-like domain-containing protein [Pontibacter cellulosilyticus]